MQSVTMMAAMVLILTLLTICLPFINGDNNNNDTDTTFDANNLECLQLPQAQHNVSSILCVIKFCERYFRSEKAVIGSLVIVNVQNTTEFHSQLIIELNERANYELGVMTKDATKVHVPPVHVVDKAKNYFVVFNRTSEVTDAINQWYAMKKLNPIKVNDGYFVIGTVCPHGIHWHRWWRYSSTHIPMMNLRSESKRSCAHF